MSEDTGTSIQSQNLIADDVADEISAAMGEQMNGAVTPPTVVKPTHPAGSLAGSQTAGDNPPAAPDSPAQEPADTAGDSPAADDAPFADLQTPPGTTTGPEPAASQPEPGTPVAPEIDLPEEERGTGNFSELQEIKQAALSELSPLVEHLEQGPEDKFNTLLMMIRASDDASLVSPAYEAAKQIEDDKKRAQALLDVVNEVNYLTRPQPEDNQ
jgi:hypothetical protein